MSRPFLNSLSLVLGLVVMLAFPLDAMALRNGYKVYRKTSSGKLVRPQPRARFNTSSGRYRYVNSSGRHRQIVDTKTGEILYVHRKAVTNSDRRNPADPNQYKQNEPAVAGAESSGAQGQGMQASGVRPGGANVFSGPLPIPGQRPTTGQGLSAQRGHTERAQPEVTTAAVRPVSSATSQAEAHRPAQDEFRSTFMIESPKALKRRYKLYRANEDGSVNRNSLPFNEFNTSDRQRFRHVAGGDVGRYRRVLDRLTKEMLYVHRSGVDQRYVGLSDEQEQVQISTTATEQQTQPVRAASTTVTEEETQPVKAAAITTVAEEAQPVQAASVTPQQAEAQQPVRTASLTNNPHPQKVTSSPSTNQVMPIANLPIPSPRPSRDQITAAAASGGVPSFCYYPQNRIKQNNCMKIVNEIKKGKLPKKPVEYALKNLHDNYGKRCAGKKITNGCQVFVTDLDKRVRNYSNRSPAYFFNLCVGDKSKTPFKDVINRTFTNRGTGSANGRYTDIPGRRTTLPGVFVSGHLSGFHPYRSSRRRYAQAFGYRTNDKRCQGSGTHRNNYLRTCPVLRLAMTRVGGAITDPVKPMHTSPFRSSSGCPSLAQKDNWIMRSMRAHGQSLYIAYTGEKRYASHFKRQCRGESNNQQQLAQADTSAQ